MKQKKHLPLGSNPKICMMLPETLEIEGSARIVSPKNEEIKYSRDAHIAIKHKILKGKCSVELASILQYVLEIDPVIVKPEIGHIEVELDERTERRGYERRMQHLRGTGLR